MADDDIRMSSGVALHRHEDQFLRLGILAGITRHSHHFVTADLHNMPRVTIIRRYVATVPEEEDEQDEEEQQDNEEENGTPAKRTKALP